MDQRIPVWVAKIQNTVNTSTGEDVERQEHSVIAGGSADSAPALEGSSVVSYKTKHTLTFDLAVNFLSVYPKELKIHAYIKTCTQMFTAFLFITAKT